ncbi:MAG: ATP-binding protein [Planctomycetes bacterium]|nr:ATP-binding protein [Planctomycetota bacterium]MCK5578551.1 ATP-binding protein [Planctomycetota bacterium]
MLHERLSITSEMKFLDLVRNVMQKSIRKSKLSDNHENKMVLAVDEAVSNVIEHAYELQKNKFIDIQISSDDQRFQVTIEHKGKSFDPKSMTNPNIRENIRQGKKRGLGIFLIRQTMDEVKYSFKNGQNKLILIKYIT